MTYTLEIPIEAAHMAEAEKKAWRILGGLPPGTPFRLALEGPSAESEPAQPPRQAAARPARLDARRA
jgi:hypothetical protein